MYMDVYLYQADLHHNIKYLGLPPMLDHCLLHKSFVLTVVPAPPPPAKTCRYYISKNQEKLFWTTLVPALQVSGAGFGDDRSMADYISGSRAATNMGVGLTCRQTLGLIHIMGKTALDIG